MALLNIYLKNHEVNTFGVRVLVLMKGSLSSSECQWGYIREPLLSVCLLNFTSEFKRTMLIQSG